jgi:hypothetical protein
VREQPQDATYPDHPADEPSPRTTVCRYCGAPCCPPDPRAAVCAELLPPPRMTDKILETATYHEKCPVDCKRAVSIPQVEAGLPRPRRVATETVRCRAEQAPTHCSLPWLLITCCTISFSVPEAPRGGRRKEEGGRRRLEVYVEQGGRKNRERFTWLFFIAFIHTYARFFPLRPAHARFRSTLAGPPTPFPRPTFPFVSKTAWGS